MVDRIHVKIFENASRITEFIRGPPVLHNTMRNKTVEFNPKI